MTTQAESYEFQVETRQLLQLMINSIYSDKDLFLRELISNASDALDKLRLERFHDDTLDVDTSDLHIRIDLDAEARTLTIADNGIGMSRDEVVDLIGKIANSGTAEFVRQLKEAQREQEGEQTEELIGRFGVGFYSSFMVADRVTLITRRAGQSEATQWESAGEATYTLQALDDAPQARRSRCTSSRRTRRTGSSTTPTRARCGRSSLVTRTSSPGRSGWFRWRPPRRRTSRSSRRSTPARRCGPARPPR